MTTEIELRPTDPDDVDVATFSHDAVILPQQTDGDLGIYRDEQVALKKELLAAGVDADFLHDPEHRTWLGLKGDVVINLAIGLLTSGAVAAIQGWLTNTFGRSHVRLKVVRVRHSEETGESRAEWYEAEGNGEDVARALEAIRHDADPRRPI